MRKNEKHGIITAFFVFLMIYAFLSPSTANAETCTAATSGSWANGSIWDCGHAPISTDDAVITDGAEVVAGGTLDSFYSLTIDGNAELDLVPALICHTPDPVDVGGSDGRTVTFTDCSMGTDETVYVNWGDDSTVSTGSPGDSFTHDYLWNGNFLVSHSIASSPNDPGVAETIPVSVPLSSNGTLTVTTDPPLSGVNVYAYKGTSTWHVITDSNGSGTLTPLPAGQYTVYLYYPTNHGCDFANNTSFTVVTGETTTVYATQCY